MIMRMRRDSSTRLLLLAIVGCCLVAIGKADGPISASATATSTGAAATHTVNAGTDGFSFIPNSITANVGDIVQFIFHPDNHSVARAEFQFPCIPYELTGPNKVGFWSGFEPVAVGAASLPTYSIRINDTSPIFFYCSAPDACIKNGMIGAINPNSTETLDAQLAWQKNATIQLSPGETPPPESGASPTSTSPASASSSGVAAGGGGGGLPAGAIAGIVVGVVVLLAAVGLIFYLCGWNRNLARTIRYSRPPNDGKIDPRHVPEIPSSALGGSAGAAHSPYSADFEAQKLSPSSQVQQHNSYHGSQGYNQEMTSSPRSWNEGYAMPSPNPSPGYYPPPHHSPTHPIYASYMGAGAGQQAQHPNELSTGHDSHTHYPHHSYLSTPPSNYPPPASPPTVQGGVQGGFYGVQEVHELDARSSLPFNPSNVPPQYTPTAVHGLAEGVPPPNAAPEPRDEDPRNEDSRSREVTISPVASPWAMEGRAGRQYSFSEGRAGERVGVEKVLRD